MLNRTDGVSLSPWNDGQIEAVRGNVSGAGGPPDWNVLEPALDFFAKGSVPRILCGSELLSKAVTTK